MSSRALAQRRQVQRDDVQPVVEIAAEVADANLLVEIAIRRRDDARVDRNRLRRADGNDFAMLQRAQQLDLRRRRRLADFVEEERALRRRAEQTDLVANRAGERALHVTEQFALEQAFGERAAVDREERSLRAHRQIVDVAGDDFLTGSRLALNEHRGIGRRDRLDETQHVEPRLARADGTRDRPAVRARRIACLSDLFSTRSLRCSAARRRIATSSSLRNGFWM